MRAAVLLTLLFLTGCGVSGPAAPSARSVEGTSIEGLSLQGDLLRRLGPIAARKAVQAALNVAIKNDAKAAKNFEDNVSKKPAADQLAFLNKRLKSMQRAVTGAEVALAANVALAKRDDVAAVRAALEATKAEDKKLAKGYDEKGADAERIAYLIDWADALAAGLARAEAAF